MIGHNGARRIINVKSINYLFNKLDKEILKLMFNHPEDSRSR